MLRRTLPFIAATLVAVLITQEAHAWGPRARRAITLAAVEIIRQEFADAFRASKSSYRADLLRGAADGIDAIRGRVSMNNDTQIMAAISHEIQLLRKARSYGAGSFFAYRMGVLSALAAETILPYGIPLTDGDSRLTDKIDADLEAHVNEFSFSPIRENFAYLRNTEQYFAQKRLFYEDDKGFIADDYNRGQGYRGFLSEAGATYFERSIDVVSDVWYTVLRSGGDETDVPPSPQIITWYFVDEIEYLLTQKQNTPQANRVYNIFERVNPHIMEAYENIGDLFYAHNTPDAKLRAVREWKIAQRSPGPQRKRSALKLSTHFFSEGNMYLARATTNEAADTDLEEALRNFEQALEFDQTSTLAADKINETTVAITDRRERYETQNDIIDQALSVITRAEQSLLDGNFGAALTEYNQSLLLLEVIGSEFKDLYATASDKTSATSNSVRDIINDLIEDGHTAIENGDRALEENNFEVAIQEYSRVEIVVAPIPEEEGDINAQSKQDLLEEATGKISDAKLAQQSYRTQQQNTATGPVLGGPTPPNPGG